MVKKVVIAAAGQGTRMLHLSKKKCKHLIKVKGKPFLSYLLDNIKKAGYKEVIIVVGYKGEMIKDFLKEYKYKAMVVDQIDVLGDKEKMYGTACPVMCVKDIVKDESFIYLFGDNLYPVSGLKAMNIDDNHSYVAGIFNKHPEKYGVLFKDENDFLLKYIEKPKDFVSNFIGTGLYKFTKDVFKKLSLVGKSSRGEYEIVDAVNLLAKDKKIKVKEIEDWMDFGNPGDIIKVHRFLHGRNRTKK